jgi:hypothetical protein
MKTKELLVEVISLSIEELTYIRDSVLEIYTYSCAATESGRGYGNF